MSIVWVILGFILLVIGGEFLVRSSVALSFKFNISTKKFEAIIDDEYQLQKNLNDLPDSKQTSTVDEKNLFHM